MIRKKSLFNKKIICSNCGSSFYKKVERGKVKYVCSLYNKKGECVRNIISEEYLVELIEKRMGQAVDRKLVDEHIERIFIESVDPYLLEIFIRNQESIKFTTSLLRF